MKRTAWYIWYGDPRICDVAPWRYVRARSNKIFSIRCYRYPRRYIVLLGPREVSMVLKLLSGHVKYSELSGRMRRALERLVKKKLVIVNGDDVMLSEGGKSVARVLEKHFNQKRRLKKRSKR